MGASSDLHAEDCDNADVGRLSELHRDQTVRRRVPKGACRRGDCRTVVLLDDACHHVLELFIKLGEVLDARLDDLLTPLVDLLALVLDLVGADHVVDSFFGDALHILRVEFKFVFKVGHNATLSLF